MELEEKPKILLIASQPKEKLLQESLQSITEYDWVSATFEEDFLSRIHRHEFSVIIIKAELNTMDGTDEFELIHKIKRSERLLNIPILLITSLPLNERFTQEEPMELGPLDFLFEPIPPIKVLKFKIDLLVRLEQKSRMVRKLESELKSHQEILTGVMNGVTDSIYIKDPKSRYLLVNAAGSQTLGKPVDQILGKDDRPFFSEESAKKLMQEDQLVIQLEKDLKIEHTLNLHGVRKVFFTSKTPYRNPEGKIIGVIGVSRDISEMKYFEEELKISEDRFRRLFEQAPVGIQIFSPEGRCIQINQAAKELWKVNTELLNYILNEYNIFSDAQLISKGVMPAIQKGFSEVATPLPPILYDTSVLQKGGTSKWVDSVVYPIKDGDGNVVEVVIIHSDVTERIQAENTLKLLAESSALLATSLEYQASLDKIAQLAVKQFCGWCLIRMRTETGDLQQTTIAHQDPKQALYLQSLSNRYPNFDFTLSASERVLKAGKPELTPFMTDALLEQEVQNPELFKTLRELKLRSILTVPLAARGNMIGTMTLISTQTCYNLLDQGLAEELASRAALAIQNARLFDDAQKAVQMRDDFLLVASHELRTPLTPLSLQTQTFQRLIDRGTLHNLPSETLKKMVRISMGQLQRLTSLIDSLLDVSQIVTGKLNIKSEVVNLSRLLEEMISKLSEPVAAAQCTLELEISPNIIGLMDRERIEDVILNLISNALKYGTGKPVRLKMTSDQNHAQISIQDFGPGISEEDQKRIFERFERATSIYEFGGLGLGLYIAREIVQAHGGSIQVISHLGQGSTFIIDLPLVSSGLLNSQKIIKNQSYLSTVSGVIDYK